MSELKKLNEELKEMQDKTPKVFINETFAEISTIKNATQFSLQIDQKDIDATDVNFTKAENGGIHACDQRFCRSQLKEI